MMQEVLYYHKMLKYFTFLPWLLFFQPPSPHFSNSADYYFSGNFKNSPIIPTAAPPNYSVLQSMYNSGIREKSELEETRRIESFPFTEGGSSDIFKIFVSFLLAVEVFVSYISDVRRLFPMSDGYFHPSTMFPVLSFLIL